jgi:hypothetical protein
MIKQHQAASVPTRLSGRDAEVPCRGRRMNQNSLALRIRIVIALGPAVRLGGKDARAPRSFFPVTYRRRAVDAGSLLGKTAMA